MDNPVSGNKDAQFRCPSCGEMLSVETKDESDSEHQSLGNKKVNAGNMPMGQLKSKITSTTPTTNPPGATFSNLSSY